MEKWSEDVRSKRRFGVQAREPGCSDSRDSLSPSRSRSYALNGSKDIQTRFEKAHLERKNCGVQKGRPVCKGWVESEIVKMKSRTPPSIIEIGSGPRPCHLNPSPYIYVYIYIYLYINIYTQCGDPQWCECCFINQEKLDCTYRHHKQ